MLSPFVKLSFSIDDHSVCVCFITTLYGSNLIFVIGTKFNNRLAHSLSLNYFSQFDFYPTHKRRKY